MHTQIILRGIHRTLQPNLKYCMSSDCDNSLTIFVNPLKKVQKLRFKFLDLTLLLLGQHMVWYGHWLHYSTSWERCKLKQLKSRCTMLSKYCFCKKINIRPYKIHIASLIRIPWIATCNFIIYNHHFVLKIINLTQKIQLRTVAAIVVDCVWLGFFMHQVMLSSHFPSK